MAGTRERIVQSAEKNLSRGKLDQALKDYLDLLKSNPNDAFVLNKAGDLCVRMGRPADAIGHFARIAESYSTDGFFLKAIAIFKKINKIDPTRLDIYERLAVLYTKQGADAGRAQPLPDAGRAAASRETTSRGPSRPSPASRASTRRT